jgi:hypothetical protein
MQGFRVLEPNLAIDQLTDLELEQTLHYLEIDLRWKRNRAYAVTTPQSTQIMITVRQEAEQVKKLRRERERRIIRGNYRPFT